MSACPLPSPLACHSIMIFCNTKKPLSFFSILRTHPCQYTSSLAGLVPNRCLGSTCCPTHLRLVPHSATLWYMISVTLLHGWWSRGWWSASWPGLPGWEAVLWCPCPLLWCGLMRSPLLFNGLQWGWFSCEEQGASLSLFPLFFTHIKELTHHIYQGGSNGPLLCLLLGHVIFPSSSVGSCALGVAQLFDLYYGLVKWSFK